MSQSSQKPPTSELILKQLRHPLKLRVILCLVITGAWYFSFFMPLGDQISTVAASIIRERKRIATAKEIVSLKKALAPHSALVPAGANLNDLMRRVIDQLRSSALKLIDLKPEAPKDLGPYETIGVTINVEGKFDKIDAFLGWVEARENHMRVDAIKLDPNQQVLGSIKAQITLLSMAEKTTPTPTAKSGPEPPKSKSAKSQE